MAPRDQKLPLDLLRKTWYFCFSSKRLVKEHSSLYNSNNSTPKTEHSWANHFLKAPPPRMVAVGVCLIVGSRLVCALQSQDASKNSTPSMPQPHHKCGNLVAQLLLFLSVPCQAGHKSNHDKVSGRSFIYNSALKRKMRLDMESLHKAYLFCKVMTDSCGESTP